MSDNTFGQPPQPSSTQSAASPFRSTDDEPGIDPRGRTPFTAPEHDMSVRRHFAARYERPAELRGGAIAHRFGAEDIDAVHARRLKDVQDRAFLRAAWVANAVANDFDTGDPKRQWALFSNGVTEDLAEAREQARQAGIDPREIDDAEAFGSAGHLWDRQPAHRRLGRLEHLSHQLYDAEQQMAAHQATISELAGQIEALRHTIEELHEDLAHHENTSRSLLSEVVDRQWLTGTTGRQQAPAPTWAQRLREANFTLALATLLDGSDANPQGAPQIPAHPDGQAISAAVDTALTESAGADPTTDAAHLDPLPPAHPVTGPEPDTTP